MNETIEYGPGGVTERELRLLGDVKGKRVLELGCGTGAVAVALAHQGAVVIGIDGSDERLTAARGAPSRPRYASTGTAATSPTSPSSAPTRSTWS